MNTIPYKKFFSVSPVVYARKDVEFNRIITTNVGIISG
jgi:hypothetical protein